MPGMMSVLPVVVVVRVDPLATLETEPEEAMLEPSVTGCDAGEGFTTTGATLEAPPELTLVAWLDDVVPGVVGVDVICWNAAGLEANAAFT